MILLTLRCLFLFSNISALFHFGEVVHDAWDRAGVVSQVGGDFSDLVAGFFGEGG